MRGKRAKAIRRAAAESDIGSGEARPTIVVRAVKWMLGRKGPEPVNRDTIWNVGKRRYYRLSKRTWRRHRRMATAQEYYGPLADLEAKR